MQSRKFAGFSIWRSLACFGSLVLVAGILGPVLSQIRNRSSLSEANCLSNEKVIGLAILMYAQDNDNTYPLGPALRSCQNWPSRIMPYVRKTSWFECPDELQSVLGTSAQNERFNSYGFNLNLASKTIPNLDCAGNHKQNSSSTGEPNKTVMLFEVRDFVEHPGQPITGSLGNETGIPAAFTLTGKYRLRSIPTGKVMFDSGAERIPLYATGLDGDRPNLPPFNNIARHNGAANYVACDGHVARLRPSQVSSGADAPKCDCNQGTSSIQPTGCYTVKPYDAAGTENTGYRMTFSTR